MKVFETEFKNSLSNNKMKNILVDISDGEKELSFFNDIFVFKKISNTSDIFYTKLSKLKNKNKNKKINT